MSRVQPHAHAPARAFADPRFLLRLPRSARWLDYMAVTCRHRNLSLSLSTCVKAETRKVLAYTPQRGGRARDESRWLVRDEDDVNDENDGDDSTVNRQRAVSWFLMRSRSRVASDSSRRSRQPTKDVPSLIRFAAFHRCVLPRRREQRDWRDSIPRALLSRDILTRH
jgi:hypothetical protein